VQKEVHERIGNDDDLEHGTEPIFGW
jgi:hypothetical protein